VAFLRFSRDRRGYENTYLLHATRPQGDKDRPRLLYWFRSPPHLKVGRAAFDDDARRLLEDGHPDVDFDWARLLESAASAGEQNGKAADGNESSVSFESSPVGGDTPARGPRHRRRRARPPNG
jgi:hypothetical protein